MLFFALIPGLPTISLGFVGLLFVLMSYLLNKQGDKTLANEFERWFLKKMDLAPQRVQMDGKVGDFIKSAPKESEQRENQERALNEALKVNVLELFLGNNLIKLIDSQNKSLEERIRAVRINVASTYGFIIPPIKVSRAHIHSYFPPDKYEIFLHGSLIGEGTLMSDKLLAMSAGLVVDDIEGIPVKEPIFGAEGIKALWINKEDRDDASIAGYSIIDSSTIISTHIDSIVKSHARELLGREETKQLMERIKPAYPNLIKEVESLPLSLVHQVLRELLHEKVPIKDLLSIFETIVEVAPMVNNNSYVVLEYVRSKLSRVICDIFKGDDGVLRMMRLSDESASYLNSKLKDFASKKMLLLSIADAQILIDKVKEVVEKFPSSPIILTDSNLRKPLLEELEKSGITITVLSEAEISERARFEFVGEIDLINTKG